MDKNLLLAVGLSVAVYAAWFGLIERRFVKPSNGRSVVQSSQPSPSKDLPKGSERVADKPSPSVAATEPAAARIERAELEKQSVPLLLGADRLLIHPQGASVVSWKFKGPRGEIELVNDPSPGLLATFPELSFSREGQAFVAQRADGLRVRKEFVAGSEGALPRVKITLSNEGKKPVEAGAWSVSVGPGLGTIESEKKENQSVWRAIGLTQPAEGLKGKVETFKPGERPYSFRWVGIDNRYFLAALLPEKGEFPTVVSQTPPRVAVLAQTRALQPKESAAVELPFYVGPKGHTSLSVYGAGLERAVDFGFFAQLGRFVLKVLAKLHDWTGNWGWAIILLTILLQIVLFPLTYKSMKATAAMKKLQPEIAKLQQKYSKEPAKLNTEMLELYKKSGANPLGGCLPLLLQMPIFIALFNALRNAWELHGASWIFWLRDLSAKDPYYVLPIIMGALMFVQNKMNPPSTDPAQAQVMQWMPVIFTFMFLSFPSGLVLYWLTNSVLTTVQQLALKSHFEGAPARS